MSKQSIQIERKSVELLEDFAPLFHTITSDNGKEFANHKNIAELLDIDFYFAKPYHSWQRGANENLNGLVRQYFAKDCDFTTITKTQKITVGEVGRFYISQRDVKIPQMTNLSGHTRYSVLTLI